LGQIGHAIFFHIKNTNLSLAAKKKKKKNEINIHGLFGVLLNLNIVKLLPFSSN